MGDQHGGDVHLVVQPAQPGPQILTDLGVQRPERLVEQQHLRVYGQRAGQGHALTLTAGELVGIAGLESGQPDHFEQVVDLGLDLGLGPLADLQPVGHVVAHGQMLERGVVLKDEPDPATLRRTPG